MWYTLFNKMQEFHCKLLNKAQICPEVDVTFAWPSPVDDSILTQHSCLPDLRFYKESHAL